METAVAPVEKPSTEVTLEDELGPVLRGLAGRYFEPVRFPEDATARLRALHEQGFVVHVMRTDSWVNFLYLTWALVKRHLPPVRAVVNLRRWFTRPWRRTAQRGEFEVRFTYARRTGGSGLIFLKQAAIGRAHGRNIREDPFPALVALARKGDRTVFLVPELFVWEKWTAKLKPTLTDHVFGSPEAPGFLHTVLAFWRNYRRAQFRVGEPIDLKKFLEANPGESDQTIARKVRSVLHHHLARETRAVFGAPHKRTSRQIEEILRDRALRKQMEEHAAASGRKLDSVYRHLRRDLKAIAARYHPTAVAFSAPILNWVFTRIYDGIEVDERGLERAMKAAGSNAVVLCPSHKSHVDYLVLSAVLWNRGYTVPHVAAGANLSFFPLGLYLRRVGAFFVRRSFKGDVVYTAAFKAYVKKLIHDGVHQEFFPEGGRSRTGKLLAPKLGMFSWQVDAVLEGAREDLVFVPISIDYEKIVEGSSYRHELGGGEKKPEDLKALLSAPRVLTNQYGRIHLSFDEPLVLSEFARSRGIHLLEATEDQKRSLVRALANRVMYGISRVSTITPHALVSAALLAHRRRGVTARELSERIVLLRRIAEDEGNPLSTTLRNAPSDPTVMGAIQEAIRGFCSDELVRTQEVKGEVIYQASDERKIELSFYKNTLMNMVAGRSLVARAILASGGDPAVRTVQEKARSLSRLFKLEFIYRVGDTFETIFEDTVGKLVRLGLVVRDDARLAAAPEPYSRSQLEFLGDLLRDFLESYLLAALALNDLAKDGPTDRKGLVRAALETGRGEFLAGRIGAAEALSRPNIENAVSYFLEQGYLTEQGKLLHLGPAAKDAAGRDALAAEIRSYLYSR